jgi:hypothetical protein
MSMNEWQKKYRDKANRARRGLLNEQKTRGYIDDGSGRRYLVGVYYLMAGDVAKALEHYHWFDEAFSDDVGEPVFSLFGALAHYRSGNEPQALRYLQYTQLQNIYLLPFLFDEPLAKQVIWHGSSDARPEYLAEITEFLQFPTPEERAWIKQAHSSAPFTVVRNAYLHTHAQLLHTHEYTQRVALLNEFRQIVASQTEHPS